MACVDAARLSFLKLDHNEQLLGWSGSYQKGNFADVIERLDVAYFDNCENGPKPEDHNSFREFSEREDIRGWEGFFVPEENFYQAVLDNVRPDDVIFDIGAGDLRLDLILSERVKKIYAVEINPDTLGSALKIIGLDKPSNLIVICANAFNMELPADVTLIINLMIHRKHPFPKSWNGKDFIYCLTGIDEPIIDRKVLS